MPITVKEIAWLAGLLEGEGCFKSNKLHPQVVLVMTDRDVIERASVLLGATVKQWSMRKGGNKHPISTVVSGRRAAEWMMTVYPLMGSRRRQRIRECLTRWRQAPRKYLENIICGHTDRPLGIKGRCRKCYERHRSRYDPKRVASRAAYLMRPNVVEKRRIRQRDYERARRARTKSGGTPCLWP